MIESIKETLDTRLKDVIDAVDNAPIRDSFRSTVNTFFGVNGKHAVKTSDVLSLVTTDLMKARMDQIEQNTGFGIIEREGIKKADQAHLTPSLLLWYGWVVARESRHRIKALSKVAVLPPEFKEGFNNSTESAERFFQTGELMDDGLLRAAFIFTTKSRGKVSNTCQNISIITAFLTPKKEDEDKKENDDDKKKEDKENMASYEVQLSYYDVQMIFDGGNMQAVKSLIGALAKERGIKVAFKEKLERISLTKFQELHYLWVLRNAAVSSDLMPPLTDANCMEYEELFLREIVADKLLPFNNPGVKLSFTDQAFLFVREKAQGPVSLVNKSGVVASAGDAAGIAAGAITTEESARRFVESKAPNTVFRTRSEHYPSTHSIDITFGDLSTVLRGHAPNRTVVEWYLNLLVERSTAVAADDTRSMAKWQRVFVFNQNPSFRPSARNVRDINFGTFDILLFPSLSSPKDRDRRKKKRTRGENAGESAAAGSGKAEGGAAEMQWSFTAVKCNKDPKGEAKVIWFDLSDIGSGGGKDNGKGNGYDKRSVNEAVEIYKKYFPGAKSQSVEVRRVTIEDTSFTPDCANIVFLLYIRTLFFGEQLIYFKYIENMRTKILREIVTHKIEETSFPRAVDLFSEMSVPCTSSSSAGKSPKPGHKGKPEAITTTPAEEEEIHMDDIDAELDGFITQRREDALAEGLPQKGKKKKGHGKKVGTFDAIYNGTWVEKVIDDEVRRKEAEAEAEAEREAEDTPEGRLESSVRWYEALVSEKMERLRGLIAAHSGEVLYESQDLSVRYTDLESMLPEAVPSPGAVAWYVHMVQSKASGRGSTPNKMFVIDSTYYDKWLVNGSVERAASFARHAGAFGECDKVLFPVCVDGYHWCFFFTQGMKIDHKHRRIGFLFFDPLELWSEETAKQVKTFCSQLVEDVRGCRYDVSVEPLRLPRGERAIGSESISPIDSGVLVLYFVKKFFNGVKPDVNSVDCDVLRLEMITELYMNQLDMSSSTSHY